MKTIGKHKITANDERVAQLLGNVRVCKASDLAIPFMGSYRSRYATRLKGDTPFSGEHYVEHVRAYPARHPRFVLDYIGRNPRVRKVVYSTNTRLLNKILQGDR